LEEEGHTFWALLRKGGYSLMISDRPSRFVDDGSHEDEHEHDAEGHHVFHGAGAAVDGELNVVTYLYVEDADAAHAELVANGFPPLDAPAVKFYRLKEFLVRDPDGYHYALAQRIA
jgi:uncharacterized glyoxalase superfamily protein PhnB